MKFFNFLLFICIVAILYFAITLGCNKEGFEDPSKTFYDHFKANKKSYFDRLDGGELLKLQFTWKYDYYKNETYDIINHLLWSDNLNEIKKVFNGSENHGYEKRPNSRVWEKYHYLPRKNANIKVLLRKDMRFPSEHIYMTQINIHHNPFHNLTPTTDRQKSNVFAHLIQIFLFPQKRIPTIRKIYDFLKFKYENEYNTSPCFFIEYNPDKETLSFIERTSTAIPKNMPNGIHEDKQASDLYFKKMPRINQDLQLNAILSFWKNTDNQWSVTDRSQIHTLVGNRF